MSSQQRIPNPVAAVVGDVLGSHYFNHTRLNSLFLEKGAPGDPPEGNCVQKCTDWLKRASADTAVDALAVLGGVLEEYMEVDDVRVFSTALGFGSDAERPQEKGRQRVRDILSRSGMTYERGGRILGANAATPSRTLESVLKARDLSALNVEFERATRTVESDPATAITAACAIVEAFCKVFIEDEGLSLPSDQTIKPLWKTVQTNLGLDPAQLADDDLKKILSGLSSIVDGIGALRTHTGSAHGRGRSPYRPAPRHARLTLHAAHSLINFAIETWDARKARRTG